MNKKRIVPIAFFATVLCSAVILVIVLLSYHKLQIQIPSGISFNLFKVSDGNYIKVADVKSSGSMSLQNGTYCLRPADNKYSSKFECVIVKDKDKKLIADPDFSEDYLATLLADDISEIKSVITAKYSPLIEKYYIGDGQLFKKGDWYGTTLTEIAEARSNGDTYRIVLHKVNDKWTVAAKPQIVISARDYGDIPFIILSTVNNLAGYY